MGFPCEEFAQHKPFINSSLTNRISMGRTLLLRSSRVDLVSLGEFYELSETSTLMPFSHNTVYISVRCHMDTDHLAGFSW